MMSSFTGPMAEIADKKERLRFAVLLVFVFLLPYDIFYSTVVLLTFLAITIIDLSIAKLRNIPRDFWVFQTVYILSLVGYFYSSDKGAASSMLERQLSILLLPLFIPLAISVNTKKINAFLQTLTCTSFLAVAFLFGYVFYIALRLDLPLTDTLFSGSFFNHQFSKPIGIHAGYLSLYVSLSLLYCVKLFNKTQRPASKMILALVLLILGLGMIFLAARNTIIATLFILFVVFPLFRIRHKWRFLITSLLFLTASFQLIKNVGYLNKRFSEELILDISPNASESSNYSFLEPRVERWKGALGLIKKSPFTGYGTGDEIRVLKTEYIKRGLVISYIENFNAHNQYLSILLKHGFIGLTCFLASFAYFLRRAILHKDIIYTSFVCLLLIGFYTENILDANKGIFFFAFFNTVLGYGSGSNCGKIRNPHNLTKNVDNAESE